MIANARKILKVRKVLGEFFETPKSNPINANGMLETRYPRIHSWGRGIKKYGIGLSSSKSISNPGESRAPHNALIK